jgi:hypothetical protein
VEWFLCNLTGLRLKEKGLGLVCLGLAAPAPFRAVLHDPVGQGLFEADVVSCFFRLNPFVFQDLLSFCLELPVKGGILDQIIAVRGGTITVVRHRSLVLNASDCRKFTMARSYDNQIQQGSFHLFAGTRTVPDRGLQSAGTPKRPAVDGSRLGA